MLSLIQLNDFLLARIAFVSQSGCLPRCFVDIVESTKHVAAMGDNRWRELLNEFYRVIRDVLQHYRGREINPAGDGLLAAFEGIYSGNPLCQRAQ